MGSDSNWGSGDWSFKDQGERADKWVSKQAKKRKKKNKKARSKSNSDKGFYSSDEWRSIRYRVLRKYSATCMCCGRNYKRDGVVIHVDHIKPRSKYPKLELCFDNLQVLCADCNLGKMAKYDDDWRVKDGEVAEELDRALLSSSPL